ncbi:MAG: YgeY family selenium metabolism-linked hydrolase [Clostridia bacterium]|nr:YgeY family selenium metabolism-linked hydrolase [Clostridia bacterium]
MKHESDRKKLERYILTVEDKMHRFLRDMIEIPSTSCHEKALVKRIVEEMESLGYEEIKVDEMGNVLGRIGRGKTVIVFDGHIDTVDVGEAGNWTFDPFKGKEDEDYIYGRGASDQEGGFAAAVYAGKAIKELDLGEAVTLWVVGSIQEEDCDGLCWQYILDEEIIKPDFVVLTEPTALRIHRGHRGRMEIKVSVQGVSAHGSAPERGDNAIYKMAAILKELEALNLRLTSDDFLGKGSLTVSEVFSSSPSRCAVSDKCWISVDRRLTFGETAASAMAEIEGLESVATSGATVEMYDYSRPSYTGYVKQVPCYFPTWTIPGIHPICRAMVTTYERLFDEAPIVDKWTFSTNGVAIMGMHGIPCIGFGPGHEEEAHAPNEKISKKELKDAVKQYALLPKVYMEVFQNER